MKIRGGLALIVAVLVLAGGIPFVVSDGSEAVPDGTACDGILIYEVAAKFGSGTNEGFSLKNYGTSSVSLKNYYLTDSETVSDSHKFLITADLSLGAGEFVTFTKAAVTDWFGDSTRTIYTYSAKGTAGGSFALTNTGDYLNLYDSSNNLIDTVVFGNCSTTVAGWFGMPADLGNKGDAVRRVENTDTNTYFDWTAINNGYTANGFRNVPTFANAKVTPFTFPECKGKPIFDAVMAADSSVYISIYMLTSKEMISALNTLASEGKDVKIMLEKKPLGYDHDYGLLKNIDNQTTGSVCFIGNGDADRYSYVHNKYAIIDGDTVIVTSENWTGPNLGSGKGNRGWGAIVESTDYATYMMSYFTNDITGPDIQTFAAYESEKGAVTPADLKTPAEVSAYVSGLDYTTSTYTADIKMYMSPDNTFKALQYYIDKATTRVYTEQMDVGASYMDLSNLSPLSAMVDAAGRGVDARFLLSASEDEDKALVNELNLSGVKAANMTSNGYATMHNKGAIIDDAVWVSSVNWTENAFMNNRECGLYIMSADVADFYASAYEVDWEHDYVPIDVTTHSITYDVNGGSAAAPTHVNVAEGGKFTVAEYSGTKEGFTFGGWSDGKTVYQPGSKYTMGTSDVTLTAVWTDPTSDSNGNVAGELEEKAPFIAVAGAVLLAILGVVWKMTKKKAKKQVRKATKGNKR